MVEASRPVRMTNSRQDLVRKSILVYDGDCSFCCKSVARIAARDRDGTIEFVARQTEGLSERFPTLKDADFNKGMRLITPDDVIYVGADAAHQVARRLPYWRRVAWLYRVPGIRHLTRAGYAWVAANRQSLGGKCDEGNCQT
jgi:predicted DCC family thiol-disulfide oxidoreductase YuxK